MPGKYISQLSTEALKETAVLTLVRYFIADCRDFIEDAESEVHNIAKSAKTLSPLISDPIPLKTLASISDWHSASMSTQDKK